MGCQSLLVVEYGFLTKCCGRRRRQWLAMGAGAVSRESLSVDRQPGYERVPTGTIFKWTPARRVWS